MQVTLDSEEVEYIRELCRKCRKTNDPNDIRRLANLIEYRMANLDHRNNVIYLQRGNGLLKMDSRSM